MVMGVHDRKSKIINLKSKILGCLLILLALIPGVVLAAPPTVGPGPGNVLTPVTTNETRSVTVTLTPGSDPDGDPLTHKITGLPVYGDLYQFDAGVFGDPITTAPTEVTDPSARVIYVPAQLGTGYTDTFSARVNDGIDDSTNSETVSVNVTPVGSGGANNPPVFTTVPTVSAVVVGGSYRYDIGAADPDPDDPPSDLSFTGKILPGWLTLTDRGNGTATLSGTPTDLHIGDHSIIIEVSDDGGAATEQVFSLRVISRNLPPTVGTETADVETRWETDEDTLLTITLTPGTDPNGDELTHRITDLPEPDLGTLYQFDGGKPGDEITFAEPITFAPVTDPDGRVLYEPADVSEPYEVTFSAKVHDGTDESANLEVVTVVVTANNEIPEITSSPPPTTPANEELSYTVTAEDADTDHPPDSLWFWGIDIPDWLELTDNGDGTATLAGTPGDGDVGGHEVAVRVSDPLYASSVQRFTLLVIPSEVLEIDAKADLNNEITVDTTWDNDKVIIKAGDGNDARAIVIRPGVTLTIPAGTILDFQDGMGLEVRGGLVADGTLDQMVTFAGTEWGGIAFYSANRPSRLSYSTVEGVKGTFSGGINITNTSDLIIEGCSIADNSGVYGGGIYMANSSPTITETEISRNKDCQKGGGIYMDNSTPTLTDVTVSYNENNHLGGGLYLSRSDPELINLRVTGNSAQTGGGLYLENSDPTFQNAIITINSGLVEGGGLYLVGSAPRLVGATIASNLAGAGAGLFCESSSPVLENSILYGNHLADEEGADSGEPEQVYLKGGSSPSFAYCDVEGGSDAFAGAAYSGSYENGLDVAPGFSAPSEVAGIEGGGTWTLTPESPLVNMGNPDASGAHPTDFAGDPRPFNGVRSDIGAFEVQNNPPVIGEDPCPGPATDEDTAVEIVLTTACPGEDPDGHPFSFKIVEAPQYGELFQVENGEKGSPVTLDENTPTAMVTDPDGRLIYVPGNRSADYEETIGYRLRDTVGEPETETDLSMDSRELGTIAIPVTADNDPPAFLSEPVEITSVGADFSYPIEVEDPDATEVGETLALTAPLLPAWLTLEDAGDGTGTLAGTSETGDVGDHSVILRVTDDEGAFTEQSFIITVGPRQELSVNAGEDLTGEPGTPVFLVAEGSEGETITYTWEVLDETGAVVGGGEGPQLGFTPPAEGIFTASVRVEGETGAVPAFDELQISVAAGFAEVNDTDRQLPTPVELAQLGDLAALNPFAPGFDPEAALTTANDLSALALDAGQTQQILEGVSSALAADEISSTAASQALGTLDNLINETVTLGKEEVDGVISSVSAVADKVEMTAPQIQKATEVLNELIEQGDGPDRFSLDQVAAIDGAVDRITREAAALADGVDASSMTHVKITATPLDTLAPLPTLVGGRDDLSPRMMLTPPVIDAIASEIGLERFSATVAAVDATRPEIDLKVSAGITAPDGTPRSVAGLGYPVGVELPVSDESRTIPLFHDATTGLWQSTGITGVGQSPKGIVSFRVDHLTDFALFAEAACCEETESEIDKPVESVKDLGSEAGCFVGTIED